jgi:hypothetical protein
MKGFNHLFFLFFLFFLTLATACGGGGNSNNATPNNIPPVATAGQDISQTETLQVTLSGTESNDTDGTISSYLWRQTSGTQVSLSDSDKATASFTAPSTDTKLTLEFELSVTDNMGASSTDNVLVTVMPNSPPPVVTIDFPISGSRFFGDYITVSGTASKQGGIDGTSINVKVANSNVNAQVDVDGNWRAQNVPLPTNLSYAVIRAIATDRVGETGETFTAVQNVPTLTKPSFTFDPQLPNILYAIDDDFAKDRIIAIDLDNMQRQLLWSGENMYAMASTAFDPLNKQILLGHWQKILALDISENLLTTFELVGEDLGENPIPYGIVVDSENNRAIFVDEDNQVLVSINLSNGDITIISNNSGIGAGILFDEPVEVALETAKNRALVYDSGLDSILAVDLSTGNRSIIASNTDGTGHSLSSIRSLQFDSGKLIALGAPGRILEINLENGNSTIIYDGYGESLDWPYQLLVDNINNRYLINDFADSFHTNDSDSVLALDRDTKELSLFFKESVASGPQINEPATMAIDPVQNIGYVWDKTSESIYKVNLSTGERQLYLSNGNDLFNPSDMEFDRARNQLLITDASQKAVIAIDLATKLISTISSNLDESEPLYDNPKLLAYSEQTGKLYIADAGLKAIFEVNLNTGARSIISSIDKGAGPNFTSLTAMAIDDDGSTIYVADEGDMSTYERALISIDTSTGDRQIVSSYSIGSGSYLRGTYDIEILAGANQALIADNGDIKLVDLSSGDRITLANDRGIGKGETSLYPHEIATSANENIIYALSSKYEAIFAIDRFSGDRVIISK